jgi:Xaa-Pro dipeptidase
MVVPVCPDFAKEEYEVRWKRARELMRQRSLDALFVTDHVNFAYLTGHQTILYGSKSRPICLILPLEDEPLCVLNDVERENHEKTSAVTRAKFYAIDPETHLFAPTKTIQDAFKELNLNTGVVGAELGFEQRLGVTYNDFTTLRTRLDRTTFVDASELLWELRMIKSEAEIERMRKACEITSDALDKTFEEIRGNMTEVEVRKILYTNMIACGADRPESVMFAGCTPPIERKLEKGNSLILDVSAVYKSYVSDITRTAFIGNPDDSEMKDFELAKQATEKCIAMFEPGRKAYEIHQACPIQFPKGARIGHGVGREGTEPPSISGYDETVLAPGMVISIEPFVERPYGTLKVEEVIVITNDGSRTLSTAEKKLWTI